MNVKPKRGRKRKDEPLSHVYTFRLNDSDQRKFERLFQQSGMSVKAYFIYSCIFNKPIPVFTADSHTESLLGELENFNRQFRSIGVNYNQVVAKINRMSFKPEYVGYYFSALEKQTVELISVSREILKLFDQLKQQYNDSKD